MSDDLTQATSLTELFILAETRWPGFYPWLVGDPAFSEEDQKNFDNALIDDKTDLWDKFCDKITDLTNNSTPTEEEIELLLLGALRGGKPE